MNLMILMVFSTCAAVGLAVALALRKIASPKQAHPITPEWIEELSLDRYKPMLRMLDDADLEALQAEPTFGPAAVAEFRRERARIFRIYLKRLNADFASVCLAVKLIMLQAEVDRPDLGSFLLRSQVRFALGMVLVQIRLAVYELGVGTVDITPLITLFNAMRFELRVMAPESAVWGS